VSVSIEIQTRAYQWKTLLRPHNKTVRAACEAALAARKIKKGELTVVLADDAFLRELNKNYRGKDKPTNVLSFEGEGEYLGDIVLALETIKREAKEQNKRFKDHTTHLLVHGVLHLLGHDHHRKKDAGAMEELEIKILKKLGISNPYL
jgi:probable rRNA maturation factor